MPLKVQHIRNNEPLVVKWNVFYLNSLETACTLEQGGYTPDTVPTEEKERYKLELMLMDKGFEARSGYVYKHHWAFRCNEAPDLTCEIMPGDTLVKWYGAD